MLMVHLLMKKTNDCDGNEISHLIDTEDQLGPSSDDENEQQTTNADEEFVGATSSHNQPEVQQN